MKKMFLTLAGLLPLFLIGADLKVTSSVKEPGIIKTGEKAVLKAEAVLTPEEKAAGMDLDVSTWIDGRGNKYEKVPAEKGYTFEVTLTKPGWAYMTVRLRKRTGKREWYTVKDSRGKDRILVRGTGVIADPEKIRTVRQEPKDFDAFWNRQKAELAKTPLKVLEMKPVKLEGNRAKTHKAFDVKIACAGPAPVSGYLTYPADTSKKYPAILNLHGAGVRSAYVSCDSRAIHLDINAHGILNGQPAKYYDDLRNGKLRNYSTSFRNDRDKIYFRYMYLRVLRALEFLRSLPQWNGKDLIARGGSQGGGQTLAAAGLDPKVTFAAPTVPAMTGIGECMSSSGRMPGWPKPYYQDMRQKKDVSKMADAWDYYDGVFLARRIHCPVYFATGLIDTTCAPTCVYAAFNECPSKVKVMTLHATQGHEARNTASWTALDQYLTKCTKKPGK